MSLQTVDDALEILLSQVNVQNRTERRPLSDVDGCVLSEDIAAPINVPPFANSAMDGYAVRAADVRVDAPLKVTQIIAAGREGEPHKPATASRIFTGAPLPSGADAILIQEDVELHGDHIVPRATVTAGEHIRPEGQDMRRGSTVLEKGRRLMPADLALAASVGLSDLPVFTPLKIALLSTGDELVEPPATLAPGQIFNSNRRALAASMARLGFEPLDLGIVPDDEQITQSRLLEAANSADVVISTGGVSVGDRDFVKQAVEASGRLAIWKLAIKPGKPLAFGETHGKPFFGLPGNPVSSLVTFLALARPFLLKMQGATQFRSELWPGIAAFDFEGGSRQEYLRVQAKPSHDGIKLHPFAEQGSGVMSSLAWATALAVIEPGRVVREGDRVDYLSLQF
ncbi:MAG: gephyrin-like molybdotransferase Glp [Pseudomonadales bacterium]